MILEKIVDFKKEEIKQKKKVKGTFKDALNKPGISLIAEVKKASPSKGVLRENFNPVQIAKDYENGGARAISVLTDAKFFGGCSEDLTLVKANVNLPVLRKDFIIDPIQIYEALSLGADAILLIVAILTEKKLKEYMQIAADLGLDVLVEVHSREELAKALAVGAKIIGVNNRDLRSFQTDIKVTLNLAEFVPSDCILVSESGISSKDDLKRLQEVGVDAVLVGESLVKEKDIQAKIKDLLS
ncbi:indole-3-glycerol phosphate synthase [Desulfonispora thiosulfatigenes DSM 11270]|uniref:Indole-3-glycerol phosphate synthase n=1 Tax=Desulfonispora thiosulfatigenes DSM 11270 TaxID=656914 RepID=A0A1W1VAL4_DESTI|nr:indole-3-glycerol phosphate synthase TrpC [Desulfonispora thiosulfatigenes]SMB90398.1 indole-3-glycerol phosphate synthase [Desulfonispora thiosulfatigenes DSM 11270]